MNLIKKIIIIIIIIIILVLLYPVSHCVVLL